MLVLFDIDGTLLHAGRTGWQAVENAFRETLGHEGALVCPTLAGRLDPGIWRELCALNGYDRAQQREGTYRRALELGLREARDTAHTVERLAGALELVGVLREAGDVTLGLLTGNYAETARLKLELAGFDPGLFAIAAWGDDAPTRRGLPAVAMQRFGEHTGRDALAPEQVMIIGDTPRDIDCARANGCASLAVATGRFSAAELATSGATRVVPDLTATSTLAGWIQATIRA